MPRRGNAYLVAHMGEYTRYHRSTSWWSHQLHDWTGLGTEWRCLGEPVLSCPGTAGALTLAANARSLPATLPLEAQAYGYGLGHACGWLGAHGCAG
jgi:hypothetical protein